MSEAQEIVALFQRADQMMTDYIRMVEVFRGHIFARLQRNISLPHGVRVALQRPDDRAFLEMAYSDLERDIEVLKTHRDAFQESLREPKTLMQMLSAVNIMKSWSNNAGRSMETVLDYDYMESDILPPPYMYWQPISDSYYRVFINSVDNPAGADRQLMAVSHYLNTAENPWARTL